MLFEVYKGSTKRSPNSPSAALIIEFLQFENYARLLYQIGHLVAAVSENNKHCFALPTVACFGPNWNSITIAAVIM